MKNAATVEELMNLALLERCIEREMDSPVRSSSKNERINKLREIRDKFLDGKVEKFLDQSS